jgi:hypothetical protein
MNPLVGADLSIPRDVTDETVKVCANNFPESPFLKAKRAIVELALRTI